MDTQLYCAVIAVYLQLFLEKYHSDNCYVFWPDLAASHYSKATLAKYDELGIKYLPKEQSPPNAPQLRPIEKFWAHLKQKVYERGWEAKNLDELQQRIEKKMKEFEAPYFERIFQNLPSKLIQADQEGLSSLH